MKGWLRNENLLLSARHVNKTIRDTELIAVTIVRYKEAVGKAIEFIKGEDKLIDIEYERELTKRTISDNEVQKLQIQLEMMKLSQTRHVENAPRRQESPLSAAIINSVESTHDSPSISKLDIIFRIPSNPYSAFFFRLDYVYE